MAAAPLVEAQFNSAINGANLGALFGYGWSEGPAVDQSSLYGQGTIETQPKVYAFAFNFARCSEKKGLGGVGILSAALGGTPYKSRGRHLGAGWSNQEGVWGESFGLYFEGKIGPGLSYNLPDQRLRVGIRYFNWYQANAFGGTYNNSDDAASLGAILDWKNLGLAYSFGSAAIPGVLVDSHGWDSHEIEAKYLVRESKYLSVVVGVKALTQILQVTYRPTDTPDTKGTLLSFFVLIR